MNAHPPTAEALPRLPPAYRLIALDTVESTNDEAARLAGEGAEDGTIVWAKEQTKGRGRMGRNFASPRGNLFVSLVLRPDCGVGQAAELSFVAALAVGDAIGSVGPPLAEVRYKWPNDVLLNDRKVSGILLESRLAPGGALDWLILGVGINVVGHPEETSYPATNLRFEGTGADVTEVVMLQAFCRHFLGWTNRWLEDGFAPIRQTWLSHAKGIGESVEVALGAETVKGVFREVDAHGGLVLEAASGGRRVITAGDVHFGG